MNVNENILQLRGKATIARPLSLDHDYEVSGRVSITQTKTVSRQDGTADEVFIGELVTAEIKNEAGEKIEFKRKSSLSQALRWQIIMWARDNYPDIDDDAAYDMVMKKLLDHTGYLLPLIMKQNGDDTP